MMAPSAASPNNHEHAMVLASVRTIILHGQKFTEMRYVKSKTTSAQRLRLDTSA
ncbi:Protein of unknown function [Pyronema omphalodes CBS 100304]|uniref:Uncharacterized protein n=1 Tax=Pyronema omphalodes (strain CBS 100304) TaxID=1076935 RepID=U4KXV4_PYROM|nr:Protein of unknown function [Pyronema omphalodes CBS 100304]